MRKWKINGCPRCNGSMVIDKDEYGWYELCINCAHRIDLIDTTKSIRKPILAGRQT